MFRSRNSGVYVAAANAASNITGTPGDDVLVGTPGNDSLFGQDGNDSLFGEDGNDYVDGVNGDDTLRGGNGNDGPGGVALLIEALTDNRNRTASDVRHAFDKNDGNLGTSGAVAWLFERRGVVVVPVDGVDEDELTLAAAEGGADDVKLDGSTYEVVSAPEALTAVREAVEAAGFPVDSAELTMVPKTTIEVADESSAKKIVRLMEELEDNDDVQDVYANFDIPERVLETVAS